jgi:hypothetical protein
MVNNPRSNASSIMVSFKELKNIEVQERLGGGQFSDVYKGLWMVCLEFFEL